MVQLIPDVLAPEIKSPAEKRLFIEFRDHRTNKKYVVLHSLGIAEHTNNIFGEIDFVILCNEGVLCLEVKGGQVSRRNGVWEFANRYSKISHKNEGPFQQVQGNMQSLRQYMVRRLGNYDPLVRCQYACAVAMPDCRFEAPGVGIDVVPEILVDAKQSWNLDTLINQAFWYWRQTCVEKHGFEGGRLTDAEIDKLANLLRGDFHFVPSMKDTVERAVKELCALTAEQYEVLESLFDNPRTIVSGVAGAGKTLIAMEQARRAYDTEPVTFHQARPHTEQDLEIYRIVVDTWNRTGTRVSYVDLPENLRTHQNTASFLDRFKVVAGNLPYAQTIVAHIARDGHYFIHPDIEQNRSITPREAARIQTFPDNYCFESKKGTPSRTLAFKQIGNAVPVCLAYHIALSLLARFADQN